MARIRVGTSGWTYPPWRGRFYPKGLVQKRELEYASRNLTAIEINGTFYGLQKPASFQSWYDQAPDDFVFSVKAPQFMTHVLRLKNCFEPLCNFMASGVLCLKEKLGPFLWQVPPNVTLKDDRFEIFVKSLPHTTEQTAALAEQHGPKVKGRAWTETDANRKVRHAFEFRHPSFQNADFIEMLRAHDVGVVFADSGKKSPYMEDLTSDFVYMRMHAEKAAYTKGHTEKALNALVERVDLWTKGKQPKDAQLVSPDGKPVKTKRDVFVFFDNEVKENAPLDALRLIEKLG